MPAKRWINQITQAVLSVALMCVSSTTALAASFDCSKATSVVDRLICSDPTLSNLDDNLAIAYNNARKRTQDPQLLLNQQRAWLQKRNTCGSDRGCMILSYQERITVLSGSKAQTGTENGAIQHTQKDDASERTRNFNLAVQAINSQNYTLAEKILVPMEDNGDPNVQYALAVVYDRALPPLQNYSKSFELYSKAANSGDLDALYSLAMAYDEGRGTKKDEAQSTKLLIRAVDLGHRQAIVDLGLKYAEGRGVERNFDVAIEMLRKAWAQNVEGASKAYASVMKMKADLEEEARRKQILEQQRIAKIEQEERNKQEAAKLEERRLAKIEADKIAKAERDRVAKIESDKNISTFDKEYPQAPIARGRTTFIELGYFNTRQGAEKAKDVLVASNRGVQYEIQATKDANLWRIVYNEVTSKNNKEQEKIIEDYKEILAVIHAKTDYANARIVSYSSGELSKIRKNTNTYIDKVTAADKARINNPYWNTVDVDQATARDDINKRRSHFIKGTNFEINYTGLTNQAYVLEAKDGTRSAYIATVGQLPVRWTVDCKNKRMKGQDNEAWSDSTPGTQGARVLVYICTLPAINW